MVVRLMVVRVVVPAVFLAVGLPLVVGATEPSAPTSPGPASASLTGGVSAGAVSVDGVWARASATPGGTGAAGAFLTIHNTGAADRLIAAHAPVSEVVELHTHVHDGGVMRMRPVPAIDIAPGTDTVLKPGGLHVMFIGLKAPLREGERFPLDLTFERAGPLRVEGVVRGPGALGEKP